MCIADGDDHVQRGHVIGASLKQQRELITICSARNHLVQRPGFQRSAAENTTCSANRERRSALATKLNARRRNICARQIKLAMQP
jgi:hypothetical protein